MKAKKMTRSNKNKMLCGVCAGIGEYFNIDPTIVRLLFIIFGMIKGSGILLYLIAAVVMPVDFSNYEDEEMDDSKLKKANMDEDSAENGNFGLHSDEEFDSFFKKESK